MKTPVQMLETVAAEIIENTVLLEIIYKNSNEDQETDCAMACLIRSMQKTLDITNEYIKAYDKASAPPPNRKRARLILLTMYFTRLLQQENSKSLHMFIPKLISAIKITAIPQCIWHQQFSTMQLRFAVN